MDGRRTTALRIARETAEALSWRQVQGKPEGPLNLPPDPHFYVIGSDRDEAFWQLVQTIRKYGRRGKYTAPYNDRVLYNTYLELDQFVYWFVWPAMLNRTLVELRQHEWLDTPSDQLALDE